MKPKLHDALSDRFRIAEGASHDHIQPSLDAGARLRVGQTSQPIA